MLAFLTTEEFVSPSVAWGFKLDTTCQCYVVALKAEANAGHLQDFSAIFLSREMLMGFPFDSAD